MPPARPVVPQLAAPTRPVAITAAKPAPQAIAPKRRRSFTGEPRAAEKPRAAEPARGHTATKGRKRTHADDELHLAPRAPEPEPVFDDLDEDTRVISAKDRPRDEIDQALERLRSAPVPPPPARARDHRDDAASSSTSPGATDWQPNDTVSPVAGVPAPKEAPRAAAPAKRLDTLPALRVAVLATGIAGEVRLISLDAAEAPPPGAALALLVPLSGADGEAVHRLFGAIE